MKSEHFAYWLQGFFELSNADKLTADQIKIIRNHINLVKVCMNKKENKENVIEQELSFDLPELDMFPPTTPNGEILATC